MITPSFLITALIVVLIPGAGVIYTVSTGLLLGKRASIIAALGCTLGIVPHLTAALLGLSAIMHASALAFQVLKYAGVFYLLYLAYATWKDTAALVVDKEHPAATDGRVLRKAVFVNFLNPKLTIFFLAFLPHFITSDTAAPLFQLLTLSAVFMLMTFVVFVGYGLLASAFRAAVLESSTVQAWLRRSFAAAFAGLAINLALSER